MLIISSFRHSLEVEEALGMLERKGIPQHNIMAVMMECEKSKTMNQLLQPAGQKTLAFEVGMATGSAASVIGISYGFVLAWGPILWGLITALSGFVLAFGITLWIQRALKPELFQRKGRTPELTLIVRCSKEQLQEVCQVLWQYRAMSVGQVEEIRPEPVCHS